MSTYRERLLARRARFVERWLDRLNHTQASIETLALNSGRSDILTAVNKDFHQLAGAAGIYEIDKLCSDAIAAEDICMMLLRTGRSPQNEDIHSLRLMLSSIKDLLVALKSQPDN